MNWKVVRFGQVASAPWKNGGGVTRELVTWPEPDNWLWRMSVAEVSQSGPFSIFEGVQRWFAVLSGAGVRLVCGSRKCTLTATSDPFCFDGAQMTQCELIDGATRDFNLMTRQPTVNAVVTRVSQSIDLELTTRRVLAIYSIESKAVLRFNNEMIETEPASLVWRSVAPGDRLQGHSTSALLIQIFEGKSQ